MSQRGNSKKRWCWGLCRSYYYLLYPFIVIALVWSLVWSWHNVTVLRDFSGHSIAAHAVIDEGFAFSTASSLPQISRIGNVKTDVVDDDDDKDDVPAYSASDENAPWEAATKNRETIFSVVDSRLLPSSPYEHIDSEAEEGKPDKINTVDGNGISEAATYDSSRFPDKFIPPIIPLQQDVGGAIVEEEEEEEKSESDNYKNHPASNSEESAIPSSSSSTQEEETVPYPRQQDEEEKDVSIANRKDDSPIVRDALLRIQTSDTELVDNKQEEEEEEVYHDQKTFQEEYDRMLASFKIFVYPEHMQNNDPFSNIFAPTKHESRSNYASEGYFKRALFKSHFLTENASEATMFFLPFSISLLRHDKRVGIRRMDTFISSYIQTIRHKWPFWNRTGGADHFFVSCHSITKLASDNVVYLRRNAIQVVCSSNVFVRGYVPHKDIPIPQVWPRKGTPPQSKLIAQRKVLAFFAGAANSPVRSALVKTWSHDTDIHVYSKRLSTPYSQALLTSKFCLHVKGYEVNTARIADALHFGCVPVILADHYDLPFASVLDWSKFSLVVETTDIPLLKDVLQQEVSHERYEGMQKNVVKVRRHFRWNAPPCEYDAFYMTLYQLWSRRHVTKSVI